MTEAPRVSLHDVRISGEPAERTRLLAAIERAVVEAVVRGASEHEIRRAVAIAVRKCEPHGVRGTT